MSTMVCNLLHLSWQSVTVRSCLDSLQLSSLSSFNNIIQNSLPYIFVVVVWFHTDSGMKNATRNQKDRRLARIKGLLKIASSHTTLVVILKCKQVRTQSAESVTIDWGFSWTRSTHNLNLNRQLFSQGGGVFGSQNKWGIAIFRSFLWRSCFPNWYLKLIF